MADLMSSSRQPQPKTSTTCWAWPTPVQSQSSRRLIEGRLWCHPDKTPRPRAVGVSAGLLGLRAAERSYEAQGLRRVATAHHTKPALPQYRPVPATRLFPNAGRGARWTEEQWRDAGNWPYDQRQSKVPPEPRVRPRSRRRPPPRPRRDSEAAVARKGRGSERAEGSYGARGSKAS